MVTLEVIHDNYRYSSKNKSVWLTINDEMKGSNQLAFLSQEYSDNEE